jgi:ubiquitin
MSTAEQTGSSSSGPEHGSDAVPSHDNVGSTISSEKPTQRSESADAPPFGTGPNGGFVPRLRTVGHLRRLCR